MPAPPSEPRPLGLRAQLRATWGLSLPVGVILALAGWARADVGACTGEVCLGYVVFLGLAAAVAALQGLVPGVALVRWRDGLTVGALAVHVGLLGLVTAR